MVLTSSRLNVIACVVLFASMTGAGGQPSAPTNERTYKIILEKYKCLSGENSIIKLIDAVDYKVNRTHKANNVTVELLKDLPEDAMFKIDGYEKMSDNSYKSGYLNFPSSKVCEIIKSDTCLYDGLAVCSTTLKRECPFTKGVYEVSRYLLDITCLPNKIVGSKNWKFNVILSLANGDVIYSADVYVIFEDIAS